MSIFSERLKKIRTNNKITQTDIANNIGITLRAYQYYEADQMEPTISKLFAIADYFNVSMDYLAGRTDNPEINK